MSQDTPESVTPADSPTGAKQVPVSEAIKYRRRAQQAESQLQQFEQQLEELQSLNRQQMDELATAEAQRDEAHAQLTVVENRLTAERLLNEAEVVDLEAATTLLGKQIDLSEDIDRERLAGEVEQLLLDKPFLRQAANIALSPPTASARNDRSADAGNLTRAAAQAARSGNRKDVAEYLRLRRQASLTS